MAWNELVCKWTGESKGICNKRSRKLLEKQEATVLRGVALAVRQPGFTYCFRHSLADCSLASFVRFCS